MSNNYLLDAVQKLTQPHTTKVPQANEAGIGCISDVIHDPLLLQLRDSVAGGTGKHAGSSPARERIPFDAGALELFDTIAKQINAWYLELPGAREDRYVHDRLTDWYGDYENRRRAGKTTDTADRDTVKLVEGWARSIEAMFDPPQRIEITTGCPMCGARYAFDPRNGDQMTAIVIEYRELGELTLDRATGMCRSCETVWRGRHGVRELRWLIDQAEGGDAA